MTRAEALALCDAGALPLPHYLALVDADAFDSSPADRRGQRQLGASNGAAFYSASGLECSPTPALKSHDTVAALVSGEMSSANPFVYPVTPDFPLSSAEDGAAQKDDLRRRRGSAKAEWSFAVQDHRSAHLSPEATAGTQHNPAAASSRAGDAQGGNR